MVYRSRSVGYDPYVFIAQDMYGWDVYQSRLSRYQVVDGYYHNHAYMKIMSYSQALKVTEGLYKHVRGVYNPVNRLVELYVSKTFGGMLDIKEAKTGAIPIDTADDRLKEAITTLWRTSRWGQKKSLYVRNGAKLGDSFIKVVDDIHKQQTRLEVVDPAKVKEIEKHPDGTITRIEFEYFVRIKDKLVKYRETITEDKFEAQTEDGDAVHMNGRNEALTEWDNDYGFVPVQHVMHRDVGLMYGAGVTHGSLHKINELNDIASTVNDGMRKQVNLPIVTKNAQLGTLDFGADQSSDSDNTSDNPKKDTMPVINLVGENADLVVLTPTINVADSIIAINNGQEELERDNPELALHRLRDGGNLTAPGVRSSYDDAIARIQEARGNYDTGLVEVHRMAIAIGGMRGYEGYQGFGLMDMESDKLDHQIAPRPVINETLSKAERTQFTLNGVAQNMPKIFYEDMGWGEDEADQFAQAGQTQRDSMMLSSPFEQATTTPTVDDPDQSPDDAFNIRQNGGLNESDLLGADALMREAV